jgi:hypothetical protein
VGSSLWVVVVAPVAVAIAMLVTVVMLVLNLVGAISASGTPEQSKHEQNRYVKGRELDCEVFEETGRGQVARRLGAHCIQGYDLKARRPTRCRRQYDSG